MKHSKSNLIIRLLAVVLVLCAGVYAQRITGSITGTVADPEGAVIPKAKVTIVNEATNYKVELTSNEVGAFEATSLPPADYTITVAADGFGTYSGKVTVRVGAATPVTAKLAINGTSTEVSVEATGLAVDTDRATVQGFVTAKEIDNLPINGRNFLNLAYLEPGVQIVDGGSFDPTKNGFAGISIGGRTGRVTRIQVDGVDVTDETVGTTVTNISSESIQEFGVSQSSLDPSTDVTSSGAVNIITKSGTNNLHGSGLFLFRNQDLAADQRLNKLTPTASKPPFDRENWAARMGGPIWKDKMFFHLEYENINQDSQRFTNIPEFPQFSGAFTTPFDERIGGGRYDWNITPALRAFYRFNHNDNVGVTGFGNRDAAAFSNRNNTNTHVVGLDYASGHWTHSGRFSYLNFNNFVESGNQLAGLPTTLDPGGQPILVRILNTLQDIGSDANAPQNTFQDNKQLKYDAAVALKNHTLRFGVSYNRIDEAVFADFFGVAPRIRASFNATTQAFAATSPFAAGGVTNPLNFPLNQIVLGNGLGAFSELPALGFNHGGTINHRTGLYVQDTWRATKNLTLNGGLRWGYNSGLNDTDLDRTAILNLFDPALAQRPRKDWDNFGPQAGFAWNVRGNGKTVVRGGAGVFYETSIINNLLADRVLNLPPGFGNDTPLLTSGAPQVFNPGTGAVLFDFSTQCTNAGGPGVNNCFNAPLGRVIPFILQAQGLLQAASAALAANFPPAGVPPLLNQTLSTGNGLFDPDYHTPYGVQMNIGIQHELKPGLVLSVDYVRNRGARFLQANDRNRIGAADTLNVPAAQAAIAATLADFGCGTVDCVIAAGGTIADFASNGLGSGTGSSGAAFGGVKRNFNDVGVLKSQGLSLYQALQVRLSGNLGGYRFVKHAFTTVSYAYGSAKSTGLDQDFSPISAFNDSPTRFFGPSGTDRKHQLTTSFSVELPWGFNINTTSQFQSGLASSVFLDGSGGAEDIFVTDLDGDGVTSDPLTGTNRGAFGRTTGAGSLNKLIDRFNSGQAGKLTPAGVAVVNAGLLTQAQLVALGGVIPTVAKAPADQIGNDSFINTDLRISNKIKVNERLTVEPLVEAFNLFNVANYVPLSGRLSGAAGTINGTKGGTAPATRGVGRLGFGSGSFSPGTQRAFEFGVRVNF